MTIKGIRSFLRHATFIKGDHYATFCQSTIRLSGLRLAKKFFLTRMLISAAIMQPPNWSLQFENMSAVSDSVARFVLWQCKDKRL